MYVISRETVLMSLFAGQKWRQRCRTACGLWGRERVDAWGSSISIHAPACVGRRAGGKVLDPAASPVWGSVMARRGGMGEVGRLGGKGNVCSCG